MGASLFVRSPQGTSLTAAGQYLRSQAKEMASKLYQVRQDVLEIAGKEASILSIAATHALSFVFFPTWIRGQAQFETLGPLNLISDSMEACEEIMLRGEADFLLCYYHRDALMRLQPNHYTSVVVAQDVLRPLCAPGAEGKPLWSLPGQPSAPTPLLAYGPRSGLGRILNATLAKEGHAPPLRKVFTAQVAAALLNMARQGQGVAWIPLTLAADDIKAGRLLDAGEGDFSLEVEIRLFRPLHRQSRSAESFWDMIVASK